MSDYLTSIAQRALGVTPVAKPLLRSVFAPLTERQPDAVPPPVEFLHTEAARTDMAERAGGTGVETAQAHGRNEPWRSAQAEVAQLPSPPFADHVRMIEAGTQLTRPAQDFAAAEKTAHAANVDGRSAADMVEAMSAAEGLSGPPSVTPVRPIPRAAITRSSTLAAPTRPALTEMYASRSAAHGEAAPPSSEGVHSLEDVLQRRDTTPITRSAQPADREEQPALGLEGNSFARATAQSETREQSSLTRASSEPQESVVRVTIGRIEVRVAPSPSTARAPERPRPALSLAEYLKRRSSSAGT